MRVSSGRSGSFRPCRADHAETPFDLCAQSIEPCLQSRLFRIDDKVDGQASRGQRSLQSSKLRPNSFTHASTHPIAVHGPAQGLAHRESNTQRGFRRFRKDKEEGHVRRKLALSRLIDLLKAGVLEQTIGLGKGAAQSRTGITRPAGRSLFFFIGLRSIDLGSHGYR